jgi:hypothetical protein
MIDVARRDHPGLRFEVGSMTDLDLAEGSVAGLVAWYYGSRKAGRLVAPRSRRFRRFERAWRDLASAGPE